MITTERKTKPKVRMSEDREFTNVPSTTPILAAFRWTIHHKLCRRRGMDRCHQSLLNTIRLMNHLGQRGQAVGGARRIRHDVGATIIVGVVHPHHVHGCIIGGGRDDHLLGPAAEMGLGFFGGSEDTGGFANVVGSDRSPGDFRGVHCIEELDDGGGASVVDDKRVRRQVGSDRAGILAMDRVILEEVGGVVEGKEGIVDGHWHDIAGMFEGSAADETTDATEAVDSDLNSHVDD